MKDKKGFTLTEILATLVILAIVIAIAVPSLNALIKSFERKYYESLESTVLSSAKNYYKDHPEERPTGILYSSAITINGLIKNKYIDSAKVYKKKDNCTGYVVVVNEGEGNYNYKTCMVCNNDLKVKNEDDKKYCAYDTGGSPKNDVTLKLVTGNDDNSIINNENIDTVVNSSKAITESNSTSDSNIYLPYAEDFVMNNHWKKYIDYKLNSAITPVIKNDNDNDNVLFVSKESNYKPVNISNITLKWDKNENISSKEYNVGYESNDNDNDKIINRKVIVQEIGSAIYENKQVKNPITKDSNLKYLNNNELEQSIKNKWEPTKCNSYSSCDATSKYRYKYTETIDKENYYFYSMPTETTMKEVKAPTNELCNDLTYDGKPHELANTKTAGEGYSFFDNEGTDAIDYTVKVRLNPGYIWVGGDSSEKTITCLIKKRKFEFKTKSSTKAYDGKPLSNNNIVVLSGQLVEGHKLEFTVSSITEVGSIDNEAKNIAIKDENNKTVTGNYDVKTSWGKLTITSKKVEKPTAEYCADVTYNGEEQTLTRPAGEGYEFSGNKKTEAGKYTITAKLKKGYEWLDSPTNDIEFNCSLKTRKIKVKAGDSSKVYDGTPLTNNKVEILEGSLVDGHIIYPVISGTITDVGEATNTLHKINIGNIYIANIFTKNYDITLRNGMLTILEGESKKYTITLDNQSATSSGTEKIYEKYGKSIHLNSDCSDNFSSIAIPKREYNVTLDYNYGNESEIKSISHKFDGYYRYRDGNGVQLINSAGSLTSAFTNNYFNSDSTIYAYWVPEEITLPTLTRDYYNFKGWYDSDGNWVGDGGSKFTTYSNTTLYAKWVPKTFVELKIGNAEYKISLNESGIYVGGTVYDDIKRKAWVYSDTKIEYFEYLDGENTSNCNNPNANGSRETSMTGGIKNENNKYYIENTMWWNGTNRFCYRAVDKNGNKTEWSEIYETNKAEKPSAVLYATGSKYQIVSSGGTIFKKGTIYYSGVISKNDSSNIESVKIQFPDSNNKSDCSIDKTSSFFEKLGLSSDDYVRYYCGSKTYNDSIGDKKVSLYVNDIEVNSHTVKVVDPYCPTITVNGTIGNKDSEDHQWYTSDLNLEVTPYTGTAKWDWYTNTTISNEADNCQDTDKDGTKFCLWNKSLIGTKNVGLSYQASLATRKYMIKIYDIIDTYGGYCTKTYYIDSVTPKVTLAISSENFGKYNQYLTEFGYFKNENYVTVNGDARKDFDYPYETTYATYWSSSGGNAFEPLVMKCGVSGCNNMQYLGCATSSDKGEKWYTGGKKGTWSDTRINKWYHDRGYSETKNFYVYAFKTCSKAGKCSSSNSAGYEYYNKNKSNYLCEYE